MDSAHLGDFKAVAAIDIGKIEGWSTIRWYCLGCPVRLMAKACNPGETFDKVAHFALWPKSTHADDCAVAGLDRLIKKARRQPIKSTDILLGTLPYSVVFRVSVTKIGDLVIKNEGLQGGNGSSGSDVGKPSRFHRPSRSSIESICRAHAAMNDGDFRATQSLNVEGCLGSNYRDTFYQLQDIPPWRCSDTIWLHFLWRIALSKQASLRRS